MTMQKTETTAADAEAVLAETTYGLEQHNAFIHLVFTAVVTAEQLRRAYGRFKEGGVTADLNKRTIKDLRAMLYYSSSSDRKKDLVSRIAGSMAMQYCIGADAVTHGYGETVYDGIERILPKITDESIAAAAKAHQEKTQAKIKAFTEPETLAEFRQFIGLRGESALSLSQLAAYDALVYERNADAVDRLREERSTVEGVADLGTEARIVEDWHTKQECPVWLVKLEDRVDKEAFTALREKAKRLGGNYSSWGPVEKHGFLFFDQAMAEQFVAVLSGSTVSAKERLDHLERMKQERAADRLGEYGAGHMAAADGRLRADRLVNTVRQAAMAASVEADARDEMAFSQTVMRVAEAQITETLPPVLRTIRYASHVAQLLAILYQAWDAYDFKENGRYTRREGRKPLSSAVLREAIYPYPRLQYSTALKLSAYTKGLKGVRWERQALDAHLARQEEKTKDPSRTVFVLLNSNVLATAVDALNKKLEQGDWLKEEILNSLREWRRMQIIGIPDLPTLRHALRALMPYVAEADKPDKVTEMLRDLVGQKIPGYFPTTPVVIEQIDRLVSWPKAGEVSRILEPSAGSGALADFVRGMYPDAAIDTCEINYRLREILEEKGYEVVGYDFMEYQPQQPGYDLVIMNPPFENRQDALHIMRAYEHLKPGCPLISVTSPGPHFASDEISKLFRAFLAATDAIVEDVPAGAFAESGTGVASKLVYIERAELFR